MMFGGSCCGRFVRINTLNALVAAIISKVIELKNVVREMDKLASNHGVLASLDRLHSCYIGLCWNEQFRRTIHPRYCYASVGAYYRGWVVTYHSHPISIFCSERYLEEGLA